MALIQNTQTLSCPKGTYTLDQVTDLFASHHNALFQEKITDPLVIEQIQKYILSHAEFGIPAFRSGIDSFALYINQNMGFLSEFVKGCSETFYYFGSTNMLDIFMIIGKSL